MCGIIGYSSTHDYDLHNIKTLMLWNSLERGLDSTGFYSPKSGNIKMVDKASDFILRKFPKRDGDDSNDVKFDNIVVSHVRKMSVGANSLNNAHPHEYGDIVLAHNGTLNNYVRLANSYHIPHNTYWSDSQVLANALSKDIKKGNYDVLSEYDGAAAILFYNKEDGHLYAGRDYKRPLYYGIHNGDSMYISSIEDSLKYIGCTDIKQFDYDKLHKIKDGKIVEVIDYPVKNPIYTTTNRNGSKLNVETRESFTYTIEKVKESDIDKAINSGLGLRHYFTGIFSDKYTGLSPNVFIKPSHVIGYNLKYTGVTIMYPRNNNLTSASLTKNKYYYAIGSCNTHIGNILIKDDGGNIKSIRPREFDLSNFIPVKDAYVTLIDDLIDINDEIIERKGELLKVTRHNWTSKTINAISEFDDTTISFDVRYCVYSTDEEIKAHKDRLAMVNINDLKLLPSPDDKKELEKEVDDCVNDLCSIPKDKEIVDIIDDDEEETPRPWSEYNEHDIEKTVPSSVVTSFVLEVYDSLDNISKIVEDPVIFDAVTELKDKVINGLEVDEISKIFE